MPEITAKVGDRVYRGVQALVDRYNAERNEALGVEEWLSLHIKELALQEDLLARSAAIQRDFQARAEEALRVAREELMAD